MNGRTAVAHPNVRWLRPRVVATVLLVDDQEGDYKRAFAAELLMARVGAGFTSQPALATKVGVSPATIGRWENPERPHLPNAWEVRTLCRVLGLEPHELIHPSPVTERERQVARRSARVASRARRAS